jgi:hypothetical protein
MSTILARCGELAQEVDRRDRLHLALISSLPSLPLALFGQGLSMAKDVIDGTTDDVHRRELEEALFHEIMENVGDAEKEYGVRWWNERRVEWSEGVGVVDLATAARL